MAKTISWPYSASLKLHRCVRTNFGDDARTLHLTPPVRTISFASHQASVNHDLTPVSNFNKPVHVLCHEHHLEMRPGYFIFGTQDEPAPILTHSCPQADCFVYYNATCGYFRIFSAGAYEHKRLPQVKCPRDRQPMYLAEFDPTGNRFCLWRCPRCHSKRTTELGFLSAPV